MDKRVKSLWKIILGTVLFAVGTNFFLVPLKFYSGGFLGFGQIVRTVLERFFGIELKHVDLANLIYYAINLPVFFSAYKYVGKKFFFNSLLCLTIQTFFLLVLKSPKQPIISEPLTAAVLGGILAGYGVGLTLQENASSGGTDMFAMYLMKSGKNVSVGSINIILNIFIYGTCALLFDLRIVIYSFIYVAVFSFVADRIHIQNQIVGVIIITNNLEIITEINETLNRSATILNGYGAYTGKETHVIYTVASKYEVNYLRAFIEEHDEKAFLTFFNIQQVQGNFERHLNSLR